MSIRPLRLVQRIWVRRTLFAVYAVATPVAVLNLFLAGSSLLGVLSGFLAASSGSVLYYTEEAK